MNFFKYFFSFSILFLITSCLSENQNDDRPRKPRVYDNQIQNNPKPSDRDPKLVQQSSTKDKVIEATIDSRYEGAFVNDSYGGEKCRDHSDCEAFCENSPYIPYKGESKCRRSSRALVESIEEGIYTLLNISNIRSVNVSAGLIKGMFYISSDIIEDLIESNMSQGDLKSFLAWVAVNDDISSVFLEEDRNSVIIGKAFERLGNLQTNITYPIISGLNVGLTRSEDSFFSLAALEQNKYAFEIGYDVLDSYCREGSLDRYICMKRAFCSRELKVRIRSQSRYSLQNTQCKTVAGISKDRNEKICYIHGSPTWSYFNELIKQEIIRDDTPLITVQECNEFCKQTKLPICEVLQ